MKLWQIALAVWLALQFPLAVLVGKFIKAGRGPEVQW